MILLSLRSSHPSPHFLLVLVYVEEYIRTPKSFHALGHCLDLLSGRVRLPSCSDTVQCPPAAVEVCALGIRSQKALDPSVGVNVWNDYNNGLFEKGGWFAARGEGVSCRTA